MSRTRSFNSIPAKHAAHSADVLIDIAAGISGPHHLLIQSAKGKDELGTWLSHDTLCTALAKLLLTLKRSPEGRRAELT